MKFETKVNLLVVTFFVLFGALGIYVIIPHNQISKKEQQEFAYMDSCWIAYRIIDAAYGIDDGDAFDMDCVNIAAEAYDHGDFITFCNAWKEVDKHIILFLKYRQYDETAAFNLLLRYYPGV